MTNTMKELQLLILLLAVSVCAMAQSQAQAPATSTPTKRFPIPQERLKLYQEKLDLALIAQSRFQDAQQFYPSAGISKDSDAYKQLISICQKEMELRIEQYQHFVDMIKYEIEVPKGYVFNAEAKEWTPSPIPSTPVKPNP